MPGWIGARRNEERPIMISSMDRWNTLRGMARLGLLAAVALGLGTSLAMAQDPQAVPKTTAAPKSAPAAAPAAPAPAAAGGGRSPRQAQDRGQRLGQALPEERPDRQQADLPRQSRRARAQYRDGSRRRCGASSRRRGQAKPSRQIADRLFAGDAGRACRSRSTTVSRSRCNMPSASPRAARCKWS